MERFSSVWGGRRRSPSILRSGLLLIGVIVGLQIVGFLYTCAHRRELAQKKPEDVGNLGLIYLTFFVNTFLALGFQYHSCIAHKNGSEVVRRESGLFVVPICIYGALGLVVGFIAFCFQEVDAASAKPMNIGDRYMIVAFFLAFFANTLVVVSHWLAEAYPDASISDILPLRAYLPSINQIMCFPANLISGAFWNGGSAGTSSTTGLNDKMEALADRMDQLAEAVDGMTKALHRRKRDTSSGNSFLADVGDEFY